MLNCIVLNRTVFDIETVLKLNWIVWNKTVWLCKRNHACGSSKCARIYVKHVKWDEGERNRRLGRSISHPPNRELCLTSGLPTHWCACKLLHCAIDPNVAFWYEYSKSCLNTPGQREAFWVLATHDKRQAWV